MVGYGVLPVARIRFSGRVLAAISILERNEWRPVLSDALVFFGATGDLAYKQIFPALQGLIRDEGFSLPIIGVAKAGWTLDQLKARAKDSLENHGGIDQAGIRETDGPAALRGRRLQRPEHVYASCARNWDKRSVRCITWRFRPSLFAMVAENLAKSGCATNARVVVEKPFGRDLEVGAGTEPHAASVFPRRGHFPHRSLPGQGAGAEHPVHALRQPGVRAASGTAITSAAFRSPWRKSFGVQDRGKFYDEVGTLLDVVQNHMLQVVANLTIDPPTGEDHDAMRDRKAELMRAVRPLTPDAVVRGQYEGYRSVPGVAPGSNVETFIAIRLHIDSWRWAGVPIYIRAGKMLPVTCTEAVVEFKRPPRETFGELVPAQLGAHAHPGEPGHRDRAGRAGEDSGRADGGPRRGAGPAPPGRSTICLRTSDCWAMPAAGTAELFSRQDLVEAQWRMVEPILGECHARLLPISREPGARKRPTS